MTPEEQKTNDGMVGILLLSVKALCRAVAETADTRHITELADRCSLASRALIDHDLDDLSGIITRAAAIGMTDSQRMLLATMFQNYSRWLREAA